MIDFLAINAFAGFFLLINISDDNNSAAYHKYGKSRHRLYGIIIQTVLRKGGYMLYEKKMLILSGDGKGVVLIEKSATGTRFSLRTFDMPICGELKAGVITRKIAVVRDLPQTENPACVFTLDIDAISDLHFAVFDKKLRLYGTNGKKMWEANVMDLLNKNDRRAPVAERVPISALPPISKQPKVLPLPDGTGIPQSRLELYGDEALAESDFYTPLDLSSRMPVVDDFLDSPRILDGLAPRIEPPQRAETFTAETAAADSTSAASASDGFYGAGADRGLSGDKDTAESVETAVENYKNSGNSPDTDIQENNYDTGVGSGPEQKAPVDRAKSEDADNVDDMTVSTQNIAETDRAARTAETNTVRHDVPPAVTVRSEEAAAVSDRVTSNSFSDSPWELEARWLKSRSRRAPSVRVDRVRPVPDTERVRRLRESAFIERARADVDALFANAPKDERLASILPDMEWVKVNTDGNTISVGRSGSEFLCYAVSGVYRKVSPLGDEAQWAPSDRNIPTGKGFWLIFQNLATGEIIKGG